VSAPLLLALDTSTSTASIALFDGSRVLSETTWLAGREHSTRLLIEVQAALERVGKTAEQLSGLVVARGPGSFTGVRVALSVAKGMATALAIPAWGVSTLEALALAGTPSDLAVRVVVEAGRSRYATALYERGAEAEAPRLVTLDQLIDLVTIPTSLIGELSEVARSRLKAHPLARLAPKAAGARRAGYVAELGWRIAQRGDPGDARVLDALYVS
jgi:tRNA threonylcarbamoyladenosine biosynthesis protein TsaB